MIWKAFVVSLFVALALSETVLFGKIAFKFLTFVILFVLSPF